MVLQTFKETDTWILMQWQCAYIMKWPNILSVAKVMINSFTEPEVIIGNKGAGGMKVNPASNPEEKEMLVVRGISKLFNGKASVTFHTNTNNVTLNLPKSMNLPCNYEALSKAAGLFMDTIELRMYSGN